LQAEVHTHIGENVAVVGELTFGQILRETGLSRSSLVVHALQSWFEVSEEMPYARSQSPCNPPFRAPCGL